MGAFQAGGERRKADRDEPHKTYAELEWENKGLRQNLQQIQRAAKQMQLHLDNKDLFLGLQATDEDIIARFNTLLGSIKTWALDFTNNAATGYNKFGQDDLEMSQHVVPILTKPAHILTIFQNAKKTRLFARGLVAYIISNYIFRTMYQNTRCVSEVYDFWLDKETRESFGSLENRLCCTGSL